MCRGTRGPKDVDDATSLAARVTSHVTTLPAIDLSNEKARNNSCYLQDCVTTGVLLVEGMLDFSTVSESAMTNVSLKMIKHGSRSGAKDSLEVPK